MIYDSLGAYAELTHIEVAVGVNDRRLLHDWVMLTSMSVIGKAPKHRITMLAAREDL
jgi:hypothetical protein